MRYFGGKQRIAKRLVEFMAPEVEKRGAYVEPFVGGASVLALTECAWRVGTDANTALITLWRALQNGWEPPSIVSRDEYDKVRARNDADDPMTAFAGFGCSFAGKWFGGYASSGSRNYAMNARNSLIVKLKGLHGVSFAASDYRSTRYPEGACVYLDPPYAETTGYGAVGEFDSETFWEFVRLLEKEGFAAFVSEYNAPDDFESVLDIPTKLDIRSAGGVKEPRVERLYRWQGRT